ncbi:MAG: acetate/propionate family kinase [Planctomycetota bacterium]
MDDDLRFVSGLPLFKSFSGEALTALWANAEIKTYNTGGVIIPFGQPGQNLGVILSGMAEASISEDGGERRRLGLIERGGVFGEMSLLTGEPTSADVIAVEPCRVALISHDVFSRYLSQSPAAIRFLGRLLSERLKARQDDKASLDRLDRARRSVADPYGLRLENVDPPLRVLVLDCQAHEVRCALFHTANAAGTIRERIPVAGQSDHRAAVREIHRRLRTAGAGAPVDVAAHRVSFGGEQYAEAVVIDDAMLREIAATEDVVETNNRFNRIGIEVGREIWPGAHHVAVFDTAFHHTMPPHAYLYGIPYELYEKDRLRRYGYHGISHKYASLKAAAHLKRPYGELKLITCHLGGGASICAIDHGRAVDTSMGLSPIEGLLMDTRPGDLDPLVVTHLVGKKRLSSEEVIRILEEESGLKGISGISGNMMELEQRAQEGNRRAVLAISVFCYRLRKYIGSYFAALGGLDALVFTGSVGVEAQEIRWRGCQGLSHMGIVIDEALNRAPRFGPDDVADISQDLSRVKALVVPDDTERMIARDAIWALGYQSVQEIMRSRKKPIPIGVSAHHVHLSSEDLRQLHGEGYELTVHADLMQPGQFACKESVTLIGPRDSIPRVRILGPVRSTSQVEISRTEQFKLGIDVPIRQSGDLDGTPGVTLEGPNGRVKLREGVICAARHVHMAPEDALSFGVRDGDVVSIRIEGERSLTFGDVIVRVNPNFALEMHVDTDEANAAMIGQGAVGYLENIQRRR